VAVVKLLLVTVNLEALAIVSLYTLGYFSTAVRQNYVPVLPGGISDSNFYDNCCLETSSVA
jgi:hypothetical protein